LFLTHFVAEGLVDAALAEVVRAGSRAASESDPAKAFAGRGPDVTALVASVRLLYENMDASLRFKPAQSCGSRGVYPVKILSCSSPLATAVKCGNLSTKSMFKVSVVARNTKDESLIAPPVEALVDSGSELTWLPKDLLSAIKVSPVRKRSFSTATKQLVTRETGYAIVSAQGFETVRKFTICLPVFWFGCLLQRSVTAVVPEHADQN
jgi:hypothetical protein